MSTTNEAMTRDQCPDGFAVIESPKGAFGDSFGVVYLNVADKKLGFRVASNHLNPRGVCHGGALSTFADMQIVAVRVLNPSQDTHWPTVSLSVDFAAPAPLGAWVEAAVSCVRETKSLLFTQALITADGEPIARTSGIYRIYR